jgi:putative DNA primase/helicase
MFTVKKKSTRIIAKSLEEAMQKALGQTPPTQRGYFITSENDNGYIREHSDGGGFTFGLFKDIDKGIRYSWFKSSSGLPLTDAEKAAAKEWQDEARREAEQIKWDKQCEAARVAQQEFGQLPPSSRDNPYLLRKNIPPYSAREDGAGRLYIPQYNLDLNGGESISGYQTIAGDGAKRNLKGAIVKGSFSPIGCVVKVIHLDFNADNSPYGIYKGELTPDVGEFTKNTAVAIVEGYATGCSIHQATGLPTIVAFGKSNMADVALMLRGLFRENPILFCADDDLKPSSVNVGFQAALAAATAQRESPHEILRYAVNGRVILPRFKDPSLGGDFNDLACAEGLDEVSSQLSFEHLEALFKQDLPATEYSLKKAESNLIKITPDEDTRPTDVVIEGTSDKALALSALLKSVQPTNLTDVCRELGWGGGADACPSPKQLRVAISHELIKTAKKRGTPIILEGDFYIYNGSRWVVITQDEIKQLILKSMLKMGVPEITGRDFDFVNKIFTQVSQDGFFSERAQDKPSIINLKNGTLVLSETGIYLKPFDPSDFATYQLNFDYNPNARNEGFLKFLDEMLPDADTQRTLQEALGYVFIKGLKMEKTIFLWGDGSNGKSVIYEALEGVIGKENISNYSLESLTDDKGYSRAMIKDKLINFGTDVKLSKVDPSYFKTMSTGEPVEARLPYGKPFMMRGYAKLIFNVNKWEPSFIEFTHGFFRRMLTIPFTKTIPDELQDRDLSKKMLQDPAGILNWLIEGAERVLKNRDIFISDECKHFKASFIKESDSVALFEEQALEGISGRYISYTVAEWYKDYREFCAEAGIRHSLGRNNFSKRMEALGFVKDKRETGWHLSKSV